MTDLTRRDTLIVAAACACCALAGPAADAADDKSPAPKVKSLPVGKVSDYPKAGFYDKFAKPNKVMIARLDDRLVAMSVICTHKGCPVKINPAAPEPALKCPCHKAEFSPYGTPTDGPAKTALPRFGIKLDAAGTVVVDTTTTFIESKWEDENAFVPLKKA